MLPPRGPDGFATEEMLDVMTDSGCFVGTLSAKATNQDKLYDIYNQDRNARVDVLAIALHQYSFITADDNSYLYMNNVENEVSWYGSSGERLDIFNCAVMIALMVVETKGNISTRLGIGQVSLKTWTKVQPQFRAFCLV